MAIPPAVHRVIALLLCVAPVLPASAGVLQDMEQALPDQDKEGETDIAANGSLGTGYCGLHCVYGVARLMRGNADFDLILKPKFVSGRFGSTAENLVSALAEYEIGARYEHSVKFHQILQSRTPLILHVRPMGQRTYSHWILFLGCRDDSIIIYDPPGLQTTMSAADLQSIWQGGTIVPEFHTEVAQSELQTMFSQYCVSRFLWLTPVLLCLTLCAIIHRARSAFLLIAASFIIVVYKHCLTSSGFVFGAYAIADIQASYFSRDSPTVTKSEVLSVEKQSNVVLVDARPQLAYQDFHLPASVNIPIDGSMPSFRKTIQTLDPGKRIIVYCQSSGCRWADTVASQLQFYGFSNVAVYRGGVNDWRKSDISNNVKARSGDSSTADP